MKKFYSIIGIVALSLAISFAANAAPKNAGKSQQESSQASTDFGDSTPGQTKGNGKDLSGKNDKRVINPNMNFRQRVETQRAIYKRAAASRNALMLQAEKERQQQSESAGTDGQPAVK